jgi:hypothetical protein
VATRAEPDQTNAADADDDDDEEATSERLPRVGVAVAPARRAATAGAKNPAGGDQPRVGLAAWATTSDLCLDQSSRGGGALSWRVYPGLFAGGRLDVMTHFMLRHLPRLDATDDAATADADDAEDDDDEAAVDRPLRVLDFACGSGVIAAALLERHRQPPTPVMATAAAMTSRPGRRGRALIVDALDADAVAITAAAHNLGCPMLPAGQPAGPVPKVSQAPSTLFS